MKSYNRNIYQIIDCVCEREGMFVCVDVCLWNMCVIVCLCVCVIVCLCVGLLQIN